MANLATVTTNYFPTPKEGFITTLSSTILSGASTVPLTTVSGLTNGNVFVGLIEPGQPNEQCFTGVVDTAGTQITSVKWTTGTNIGHNAGVTVVDYVTATAIAMITKGLTQYIFDQDGTMKAGAVDTTAVIADGIVNEAKLTQRPSEYVFDHVASGCVITGDSYGGSLNWSMTAGVVYIGGVRVVVNALTAQAVVASKDTYIDVNSSGTVTFTGGNSVANNAASPALAANSIRLGIIVSGANIASVASINQGQENKLVPIASSTPYAVTDSLGNLICPRDPNRKILGYRQITSNVSNTALSATLITGLSCPVIVPTGRKVQVTVHSAALSHTVNVTAVTLSVWDGTVGVGTQIGQYNAGIANTGTNQGGSIIALSTPTSTNKTYNAGLHGSQAGTSTDNANAIYPSYIKVELV